MAELKTQKNEASVLDFITKLRNPPLEADCHSLCRIMEELTGAPAKMWGASIVGFRSYRYTYASGKTGDWMEVGFSPRKQNLTIYMMCGFDSFDAKHSELLKKIGPHSTGNSCLYVKRLADLDLDILKKLLTHSIGIIRHKFSASTTATKSNTTSNKVKKKVAQKLSATKAETAKEPKATKKISKKPTVNPKKRTASPQPKATNKIATPKKKSLVKKAPTKRIASRKKSSNR